MTRPPDAPAPLVLVREGWDHLRLQRPLAAWASWQRALRLDPDDRAARSALDRLAEALELPASARREYRFRTPADPARRGRWDAAFRGRDLAELPVAASTFADLADDDPDDPDAPYNLALCLAWLGRNAEAVGRVERAAGLLVGADPEAAVGALRLGEILRQGSGAEPIAHVFRHAIDLSGLGDPAGLLAAIGRLATLRRLPSPLDPEVDPARGAVTVDEWLDRPLPGPGVGPLRLDESPRVLAVVFGSGRDLRLSLPSPEGLGPVLDVLGRRLGLDPIAVTRTPLSLPLLDAAAWTIRLPAWLDDPDRLRLYRENVEDAFENRWIRWPRWGPEGLTPLDLAGRASGGDRLARARLEATIQVYEEVAARPSALELYQGYPFDRLRRRLGIPAREPETVDPADPSTMSGADLDALDLDAIDDHALADAFRSADALGDDARTARLAARVVERRSSRLDLPDVFAPLVRRALAEGRPDEAIRRVDEAIELGGADRRQVFATWKAEILARIDEPDRAAEVYRGLAELAESPAVAFDGAETLLDNGHGGHARLLAEQALDLAVRRGDDDTARQAEHLLARLDP